MHSALHSYSISFGRWSWMNSYRFQSPQQLFVVLSCRRWPMCWSLWSAEQKSRWQTRTHCFRRWSMTRVASESRRRRCHLEMWGEDCSKWFLRSCFRLCSWMAWRSTEPRHNCCSFLSLSPKLDAIVCDRRRRTPMTNWTKTIHLKRFNFQRKAYFYQFESNKQ